MAGKALGYRICLIALVVCALQAIAVADTVADVATLVQGNNQFALELYAKLAATTKGNLFFSPYSIRAALAMAYGGARGETAQQMRKVLHLNLPDERLYAAVAALTHELNVGAYAGGVPAYELDVANGVWAQSGFSYHPEFLRLLQQDFGADLQKADFTSPVGAEQARGAVNRWVADRTRGKIANLVGPGSLGPLTRLALVNSIYFKSKWAEQFDRSATHPWPFYLDQNDSVRVPMMNRKITCLHMNNRQFGAVQLPYIGGGMAMLVLLPQQREGLASLEGQLTSGNVAQWLRRMVELPVHVYLPKLKLDRGFGLRQVLSSMGMGDAFDFRVADFSGIADESLSIGSAVHEGRIEVDEEGAEAAAASYLGAHITVAEQEIDFQVDHPFVFLIVQVDQGTILFAGRMVDPD